MPVLTFAAERISGGKGDTTSVTLPDAVARALVEALEGKPLSTLETEHLGLIVGLARKAPDCAGLALLTDAIVEYRRIFVRFR